MTIASELDDVKLYYFDYSRTGGLGEPIKMLLEDFEVKHEYIQLQRNEEEWDNDMKKKLVACKEKPFNSLPLLETKDGKRFFCSGPILRFIAKKIGMLDDLNDEEIQLIDAVQDVSYDWYGSFAFHVVRPIVFPENQKEYLDTLAPGHASRIDRLYTIHDGPYILGSKISYADYMVYHTIDDHRPILGDFKTYPNLTKFIQAFEERPIMKTYLASLPKKEFPCVPPKEKE
ncbi:glutathione S-transferase [Phascolomyces articulosus]|uniref:Glutathione S-transferase n=1 Tax=Phascolomyces articulosus TaxID=60185 RepID=A0AAD5PA45_9FUNG|nr:glutathione S-transferase [Phascolomyces articulosus]